MRLKIDQKDDALYLRLDESDIADSEEVKPGVILDFDINNNLVGIEILQISKRVPTEMLKSLKFETAQLAAVSYYCHHYFVLFDTVNTSIIADSQAKTAICKFFYSKFF